mmetsp:Transcript_27853/g.70400  ORF Transcript_27853/g.70400 Transcript_27853/m.70400 type:complete len:240 (+) Transcript_27853:1256-1975(+)
MRRRTESLGGSRSTRKVPSTLRSTPVFISCDLPFCATALTDCETTPTVCNKPATARRVEAKIFCGTAWNIDPSPTLCCRSPPPADRAKSSLGNENRMRSSWLIFPCTNRHSLNLIGVLFFNATLFRVMETPLAKSGTALQTRSLRFGKMFGEGNSASKLGGAAAAAAFGRAVFPDEGGILRAPPLLLLNRCCSIPSGVGRGSAPCCAAVAVQGAAYPSWTGGTKLVCTGTGGKLFAYWG